MKPFQSITVFVEYRCDSGGTIPHDRLIRARVNKTITKRGGICAATGEELIAPRKLTDREISTVHYLCLAQLRGLAERIVFEYHPLLNLGPEEFPIGDAA